MFLMKLRNHEKFSFLRLAHYLAQVDGSYGEKEREIILEYCTEMGIDDLDFFDIKSFSLDEVLNSFKSQKSKKIVVLELMILIYIDNDIHVNEKELIEKIKEKFSLSDIDIEKYTLWGKSITKHYEEAKNLINS